MRVAPIEGKNRIEIIDGLRGFALCWIFIANMHDLTNWQLKTIVAVPPGSWDHLVLAFVNLFFTNKGDTLFALLFGLSFAVQVASVSEKGVNVTAFVLRRMFVLMWIGVAHSLLVWSGDVLMLYALFGAMPLIFRATSTHNTLKVIGFLLSIPLIVVWSLAWFRQPGPPNSHLIDILQSIVSGFEDGSWFVWFWANLKHNITKWTINYSYNVRLPKVAGVILLGYLLGRDNFFLKLPRYMPWLRHWWPRLLGLGLGGNILIVILDQYTMLVAPTSLSILKEALFLVSVIPFALFYAVSFILLWRKPNHQRRLLFFVGLGRMWLTNYVLQNLIIVFLFAGWGLGLGASFSFAQAMLLVPVILFVQAVLSTLWLRRFEFGPLELVWRVFTYNKQVTTSKEETP